MLSCKLAVKQVSPSLFTCSQ